MLESPSKCCWDCVPCERNYYSDQNNSEACSLCGEHKHTEDNGTMCVENKRQWLSYQNPAGVILCCMFIFAEVYTVTSLLVMCYYWHHPLVHFKSNLKITFLIITMIGLIFLLPFREEPDSFSCQAQALLSTWVLNVLAANVLVRTPLIFSRIKFLSNKNKGTSGCSVTVYQSVAMWLVAGIGITYNMISLFTHPSRPHKQDFQNVRVGAPPLHVTVIACNWDIPMWRKQLFYIYILLVSLIAVILCQVEDRIKPRLERSNTDPRYSVDEAKLISYTCYVSYLIGVTFIPLTISNSSDKMTESVMFKLTVGFILYTALGFFTVPRFYKIYRESSKEALDAELTNLPPIVVNISHRHHTSSISSGSVPTGHNRKYVRNGHPNTGGSISRNSVRDKQTKAHGTDEEAACESVRNSKVRDNSTCEEESSEQETS